jgi:hypothetical protein
MVSPGVNLFGLLLSAKTGGTGAMQ